MQIISKLTLSLKNKKGFTLIELLVVISIIGLLSTVVLASLNTARQKGNIAAGQQFEHSTYSALYNNILMDYDFTKNCGADGAPLSSVADSGPNKINVGFLNAASACSSDSPISSRMSAKFTGNQRFTNGSIIIYGTDTSRISESFWMKTSLSSVSNSIANIVALNGLGITYRNNTIYVGNSNTLSDLCAASYPSDGAWHHVFVSVSTNASDTNNGAVIYIDGKRASLSGMCSIGSGWLNNWSIAFNSMPNIFIYFPEPVSASVTNPLLLNHLVLYNAVP